MPSIRRALLFAALVAASGLATAQAQAPRAKSPAPTPPATPVEKIKAPQGFKVELVYTVPRNTQGSWVNLAVDPKGRLIASDQYGKLYRVTPPAIAGGAGEAKVEPIAVEIGEAQGLLWAFDSLYVVVNASGKYKSGLYRVKDTDGDDNLDKVELLRPLDGNGEHGPHAVVLAPDGKSLYVVAGNATKLPELAGSLVPRVWGEDNLLPRMVDGRGFMTDEKAPGGFICRVDPEGKKWELVSMGYRNAFDIAFNKQGDLFTYDSDMEWDMNTPWYRPTRVCLAASGTDYGYRNGAGKWPAYYIDTVPPVVNIGPGSPTGIAFGYGAYFPAAYQEALFIADWSYGKLYALHVPPKGAGYQARVEEFLSGAPLPLTDLVVNPRDGALYFAIGGRKTTSALYRVTYTGNEPLDAGGVVFDWSEHQPRKMLEAYHGHADPKAVAAAWPYLSHRDRFVRTAARVAIEFQAPATWSDKALAEANPAAALEALLALTQVSAADPAHRPAGTPAPDRDLQTRIIAAIDRIDWEKLDYAGKLDLVRVLQVACHRFGRPSNVESLAAKFDARFPARGRELNVELANLLVYLESPYAASKIVPLMEKAPTQEEQIDYARALRVLKVGWTPELRRAYFSWFPRAADFKGGPSLGGFLKNIKDDAVKNLSDAEKADLKPILEAQPKGKAGGVTSSSGPARPFVKAWTVEELAPVVDAGLARGKRDFDKGRALFGATSCFACHRYGDEGGAVGPDLTAVGGRFGTRDLLESIILPSKVISDQYQAVIIATSDGQVVTGRIMNLHNDTITLNTNMLDPNAQVNINANKVEETRPSPVSMMPEGLLSNLEQEEILDLFAYLLSRGDREAKLFH